jgi:hypothetical protein
MTMMPDAAVRRAEELSFSLCVGCGGVSLLQEAKDLQTGRSETHDTISGSSNKFPGLVCPLHTLDDPV